MGLLTKIYRKDLTLQEYYIQKIKFRNCCSGTFRSSARNFSGLTN